MKTPNLRLLLAALLLLGIPSSFLLAQQEAEEEEPQESVPAADAEAHEADHLADESETDQDLPPKIPEHPEEQKKRADTPETVRQDLISLSAIFDSLQIREEQQERLYQDLREAQTDVRRAEIRRELQEVTSEVDSLRVQFNRIALSTDISSFMEPDDKFDLQGELEQLIQPLLAELRQATAESRELEQLNTRLTAQTRRKETAQRALENLEILLEADPEAELTERLSQLRNVWRGRLRDAQNQVTVLQNQLDQRLAERETVLKRTRGFATNFVRSRGRNLTLGVLAFAIVYFGMRGIYRLLRLIKPVERKGRSFSTRLFTLIWTVLGILGAISAMLSVFNAVGDWFLLSLAIIFLLGIGWAGVKTFPQFMEQFRLMLNLGAARENERILFDGVPWKVDDIGFRMHLVNPLLEGGEMAIPIRMIVGRHSRPFGLNEPWFPSRQQDWVLLSDNTYGRVRSQSPSAVRLELPGGALKTLPTALYLELNPLLLTDGYRREVIFGLDYAHKAIAPDQIPEKMRAHLQSVLEQKLDGTLNSLQVDLHEAADSSIDFAIVADIGPENGQHWWVIPRWIHTALVDLCNREGWSIAFPQLQIHSDSPISLPPSPDA